MKTLLLHSCYTNEMSYFDDWVDAFKYHPDYKAECINVFQNEGAYNQIKKKITEADLVVLHHSMNGDTLNYLMPFVTALMDRRGKLVSFVGNEVNLPVLGMQPKIKILQKLEADIIATQLLQEAGEWLYSDCHQSKVISLPHALNPKIFQPKIDFKDRKIDIGTRSARYGVYIGDNDRNNIIQYFHKNNTDLGLKLDFGLTNTSQKRFNRSEWADFLNTCKATLSTEAGSFYLEKDDITVQKIQKFLAERSDKFILPHDTFLRQIYRKCVPAYLRKKIVEILKDKLIEIDSLDHNISFEEIYDKFFLDVSKSPVYSKAISSRHFDAIGTKTLHVMYPGRYNDILLPGEHYFELKKDHSNIEELINIVRDPKKINEITSHTYNFIMQNHTHKHRLDELLGILKKSCWIDRLRNRCQFRYASSNRHLMGKRIYM